MAAVHNLQSFERFIKLCAGRIGQLLNLASLSNDAGVSASTARAWLELLQTSYIVHVLPPWFTNASKRLVKSPKLYFYDVGLACWLLGLRTPEQVSHDPLVGHLFENMVIIDVLKQRFNRGETGSLYFYRDASGNEVDLLIPCGHQFNAVEIKAGATVNPDYFRGLATLRRSFPEHITKCHVVYGGDQKQTRSETCVLPWTAITYDLPVV